MLTKATTLLRDIGRLLTFGTTREEFLRFDLNHLKAGLLCTWLVGIGRNLHNPRIDWWLHLGLGSVAYVFVLALFFWLLLLPLRLDISYLQLLTFITLTSPTGLIYAVPVEKFLDFDVAMTARFSFLAVVAIWRVALWIFYLRRFCRLSGFSTFIVSLLPLCVIITTLTMLNLEKAVFVIMGGGHIQPTSDDGAFAFLNLLTALSMLAAIPLFVAYITLIAFAWRKSMKATVTTTIP